MANINRNWFFTKTAFQLSALFPLNSFWGIYWTWLLCNFFLFWGNKNTYILSKKEKMLKDQQWKRLEKL